MNASDDYSTAIHEASHHVAADYYGIPSYPEVTPGGYSAIAQKTEPGTAGLCHFDNGPVSKFQCGVICWAGILGECMFGTAPFWAPLKPSAKTLRDFYLMTLNQISRLSDSDRRGIIGYCDTWRSCKSAFAIVRRNRARIIRLAKAMTGGRVEKPVAEPEKYPASFADFLQRVVGGSDAAEKFRAFVFDQSAKSFAASQFALDAAQQKDAAEKWTAARLAKYRAGFASADEWRKVATAFKTWSTAQTKDHPAESHGCF